METILKPKRVRDPIKRRASRKLWAKMNPEKHRAQKRRGKLKTKYGITEHEYESMYRTQSGVCAVCRSVNISGKRLAVDHNHATGQVRGLLCTRCNTAIGQARENVDILRSLIAYLEKHETLAALGI